MISLENYIKKYNYIVTKQGDIVQLKFNKQQQVIYDQIKKDGLSGKPCRIIILKGRQFGVSTFTDCFITSRIMTKFNTNGLIVAHDSQATNNLYTICKTVYSNLPSQLKPMVRYDNHNKLEFNNPDKMINDGLNSSIKVATAGGKNIGRSLTIHYMHLSEFAFWDNQAVQLLGLMQTVPNIKDSLVIIESTANGYDEFKKIWDKAIKGENDFTPLFFSWKDFEEYKLPYTGFELDAEEKQLMEIHDLTLEQISWRRYAINTLANGDKDKFMQEYPLTPEEAFITTGRPYFDLKVVKNALSRCVSGKTVGDLTIYEEPKKGYPYVIGGDTAGEGSDYFVAYVLDNTTGKRVAKYRSQVDETEFTRQVYELAVRYNNALVALEVNFSTYPTKTLEERYGYENQYVRERIDTYTETHTKAFGFKTTSITRPYILGNLQNIVNESIDLILDEDLLKEMLVFIKTDTGRPQAMDGENDDCVMAMAIAQHAREQQRFTVLETKTVDEVSTNDYNDFLNFGG